MRRQQWQGIFDNMTRPHFQKRCIERRSGIRAKYRADVSELLVADYAQGFGIAFLSRWKHPRLCGPGEHIHYPSRCSTDDFEMIQPNTNSASLVGRWKQTT
jgi:hypothetical protein